MDELRSLVREVAPDEALAVLFAPSLAAGVSDSDLPDAIVLWGFEFSSGDRVTLKRPPAPLPPDEVLDMFEDDQYEALVAQHQAQAEAFETDFPLPDNMNVNQWIRSLQRDLEDLADWEALEPLRYPTDYDWDGSGGVVESIAPYSEAAQSEFELRRLNLN